MTDSRRIPMTRTTFAVCRRVHDRRFLLRPDDKLTVLVTWLLATLAPLFDVEVHAMSVMSTHYHLVCSVGDQRISDGCDPDLGRVALERADSRSRRWNLLKLDRFQAALDKPRHG